MSWFMNATCMAGYACMKSTLLQNMFCFNWCKLRFSWICCEVLLHGNHSLPWIHNSPPLFFLLWSMKIACMLGMHDISFSTEHVYLIISEYYYYYYCYYLLCNLVYYMFCLSFVYYTEYIVRRITFFITIAHYLIWYCFSTFNEKHSSEILLKLTQNFV